MKKLYQMRFMFFWEVLDNIPSAAISIKFSDSLAINKYPLASPEDVYLLYSVKNNFAFV
jgi:hypothetical protein